MTKPHNRQSTLLRARQLKMARSAHAYVRGSTVKFYEWLEESANILPAGPLVWICGDCHLGNLGPLADAKGRVAVQIRDLDQTVIGNPIHDLIRLGLSLAFAARGSDLGGVTTARIVEQLVAGYEAALSGEFDDRVDVSKRPKSIRKLVDRSLRRRWKHLAQERLDTVKPVIPLGKRFWGLLPVESAALTKLFKEDSVRAMVTSLQDRSASDDVEMVDAAYWMKGCSSLGRLRYAAMLRLGRGKDARACLVDIKEAVSAAAPRDSQMKMPRDNAVRVAEGAMALSPNLGNRMLAGRLLDKPMVLRELTPQDLKIEIDRLTADQATEMAAYLAGVVGFAHGRQMDEQTRKSWLAELGRAKSATLGAPSWLWTSIVDLSAIHEAAYLNHCRRFALKPGG
jgi:uncharacterized protein (DUF2252 family)